LERELARALGDPSLRVVFPVRELGRCVDTSGTDRAPPVSSEQRTVTPLVRRGETVAWIEQDVAFDGLLDRALTPAVCLSLDNGRLRAGRLAQLRSLRDARREVVSEADDERRRLERDLHDSVQQQLLALGADLRVAALLARAKGNKAERVLDAAVDETASLLEDVRALAHGVYPAILTDGGIGPALATLAEVTSLPVQVAQTPTRRYPAQVEATAYRVVADSINSAASLPEVTFVSVAVAEDNSHLSVHVNLRGAATQDVRGRLGELTDRVGALDGTLRCVPGPGVETTIQAVIPCVS
jgi:signal transduction histidine kinase